jgi:hypothetical protein
MDAEVSALSSKVPADARHPRSPIFLHEREVGSAGAADEAGRDEARALADGTTAAKELAELDILEHRVGDDRAPGRPPVG